MSEKPSPARLAFGDIAPALATYTDDVLFGDVWKRTDLSPRDRSLVTVACLVALYRVNELPFHLKKALENGVHRKELIELITHLAFYSGWPTANTALTITRRVFDEADVSSGTARMRRAIARLGRITAAGLITDRGLGAWGAGAQQDRDGGSRRAQPRSLILT